MVLTRPSLRWQREIPNYPPSAKAGTLHHVRPHRHPTGNHTRPATTIAVPTAVPGLTVGEPGPAVGPPGVRGSAVGRMGVLEVVGVPVG